MENETGPVPGEDLSFARGQQELPETLVSALATHHNQKRQRWMLPEEPGFCPSLTFRVVIWSSCFKQRTKGVLSVEPSVFIQDGLATPDFSRAEQKLANWSP